MIKDDTGNIKTDYTNHDLSLPDWGPYCKKYAGLSHVTGDGRGSLMDFVFYVGYYSGRHIIPKTEVESGWHYWNAERDLSYYCYRYELEWKDKAYADLEVFDAGKEGRLAKLTFANNTDLPQVFDFHIVGGLAYTSAWVEFDLIEGDIWIGAENYNEIDYEKMDMDDGLRRAVQFNENFVGSVALGKNFGFKQSEYVIYRFKSSIEKDDSQVFLRYSLKKQKSAILEIEINDTRQEVYIEGNDATGFEAIQTLCLQAHLKLENRIKIYIKKAVQKEQEWEEGLLFDGFIVSTSGFDYTTGKGVLFKKLAHRFDLIKREESPGVVMQSDYLGGRCYGMYMEDEHDVFNKDWQGELTVRNIFHSNHEEFIQRLQTFNFWTWKWDKDGSNHYISYSSNPIVCEPGEKKSAYMTFATGSNGNETYKILERIFDNRYKMENEARAKVEKERYRVEDPEYAFSQEHMMSLLHACVNYPVKLDGKYIKYYTPGKAWGSLYLWDCGFYGLGLLEDSPKYAIEIMNQYYADEENHEYPFVFSGTNLPVHLYLYWEIYCKTKRKDYLEFFYPKAKRMYDYYAGKTEGSTFDKHKTGLLNGFDHCYNSGGWDDYPAQTYIHAHGLSDKGSPVVTTAHEIRCAKLLKLAAFELGRKEDIEELDRDIRYMSDALLKYAWDEETGYFSYVMDEGKQILRNTEGMNFNMGLDGVSPLVSDICDRDKVDKMLGHLKNSEELWTPYGITAVSQKAPYYNRNGYWNGRVWMPHQWFVWKACIGLGEMEFAQKIASTAYKLWKRETDATYNLWETFFNDNGRGGNCHQFASLSSPVLPFYNAYNKKGTVTVGLDTIVRNCKFNENMTIFSCEASAPFREGRTGFVIVMGEKGDYRLTIDDKDMIVHSQEKGAISFVVELSTEISMIGLSLLQDMGID